MFRIYVLAYIVHENKDLNKVRHLIRKEYKEISVTKCLKFATTLMLLLFAMEFASAAKMIGF